MIDLHDTLGDRWSVTKPLLYGNSRNFICYQVVDRAVPNRLAVLKTVRKSDLPSERLYDWRRRALLAEIKRLGKLTSRFLPEPVDAGYEGNWEGGEPFVVYSLIGQAPGNNLLRELLQLNGLIGPSKEAGRVVRQIARIARFMLKIQSFTEELWEAGFVHGNLNPDHIYHLRDGIPRVTGLSAICARDGNQIRPDEPGLRNTTIGYQSPEHYEFVHALERKDVSPDHLPALDAHRVRWSTYAALAFDLIWGRDLREYCIKRGRPSIEFDAELKQTVAQDFPNFFRAGDPVREHLDGLWKLLGNCLNPGEHPPSDVGQAFRMIWQDLDIPKANRALPVADGELAWRKERHWQWEHWRPGFVRFPPAVEGEESEYIIETAEECGNHGSSEDGGQRPHGHYCARQLDAPARRRSEMWPCYLTTHPPQRHYFLPGDIVVGRVHHFQPTLGGIVRGVAKKLRLTDPQDDMAQKKNNEVQRIASTHDKKLRELIEMATDDGGRPDMEKIHSLRDQMLQDLHEVLNAKEYAEIKRAIDETGPGGRGRRPMVCPSGAQTLAHVHDGPAIEQRMRALSLGRRYASFNPDRSLAYATVSVDGTLRTYPILPPSSESQYVVFPGAGRFFQVDFQCHPRYRDGLAPAKSPSLVGLRGQRQHASIREVNNGIIHFDLPIPDSPGYFVSCVLPVREYPGTDELKVGRSIPITVVEVESYQIVTAYDPRLANEEASIGKEYQGRIVRLEGEGRPIRIQFGEERFSGVVFVNRDTLPWGIPIHSWSEGSEVTVSVVSSNPGRIDYQLKFVGKPPEEVASAFAPGREYMGRVQYYSGGNVIVYVEDIEHGVGVNGIIRFARMTPVERHNPKKSFPLGAQIRCRVDEVILSRKIVSLVPV